MTLPPYKAIPIIMFSGIIESTGSIIRSIGRDQTVEIVIQRPPFFDDLKVGDSIAVNGVCLTLEKWDTDSMQFTIGYETLRVLGNSFSQWLDRPVNLERSLTFGSRVHGHLVTGHVEAMVPVAKSESLGENWLLSVDLPKDLKKFCWKKGSLALNGVSLTINETHDSLVEVCLIPETQKRTNLSMLKVGDLICFEPDSFAKAVAQALANGLVCAGGTDV